MIKQKKSLYYKILAKMSPTKRTLDLYKKMCVIVFLALLLAMSVRMIPVAEARAKSLTREILEQLDILIKSFPLSNLRPPIGKFYVVATAYSSTVDQTDDSPCITANGYDVCQSYEVYQSYDTVAANFLPMNSKIKIPKFFGDKIFTVRDRMNQRFYKRVDLWFPTRAQAIEFGKRWLEIEVF